MKFSKKAIASFLFLIMHLVVFFKTTVFGESIIPKYNKILDDVLAGKCRQNAEMAYNPLVDEQQPRLRKFMTDKMSEKNKNINLSYKST